MNIKTIIKHLAASVASTCLLPTALLHASLSFIPLTTTTILMPNNGHTVVEYLVTNQTGSIHTFFMLPTDIGVVQNYSDFRHCTNPFVLLPQSSCVLSVLINRNQLLQLNGGPQVCIMPGMSCVQPNPPHTLQVMSLDPNFPYGSSPSGNVCVTSDNFATPETMLGSWAMLTAVSLDSAGGVLPSFMTPSNVVYAVGTAALGDQLGIANCSGGCNQLNGYCFALKFNGKSTYPYMIFQSVNIAANPNSFDIYMAGGGSGAFPQFCSTFWGTGSSINWSNNIENSPSPLCANYFNNFSTINANYSVTYNGQTYYAAQTLQNACQVATTTGFNSQNFSNVSVVPVTCPRSLTQITGIELPSTITTVGNQVIQNLSTLTDNNFATTAITGVSTTQMEDCKTPSSGYCGNVGASVAHYQASISATTTGPILTASPPSTSYCQSNPGASFCSWNNGQSSGSAYCNASASQCISCGNGAKWCTCNGATLIGCQSSILG
ncbi:hypothetical protein [Legionella maceachernii]|uniref:Glycoside hydrolase family 45 n=1 Tax=Legionella maceachernii TaxID=466 RepID=A0A0W0VXB0_9GAMM|nr:hypothetical protein [Legionella maceachernii]KTD24659.1 glycoside hydrolase family 45 [Legionella maceachernii]SKA26719.1 Glycosyl hydrolase family 45 [Legionella maceachernii]SUP01846.1 Uncharacterised protein [Legionella maceachernii]